LNDEARRQAGLAQSDIAPFDRSLWVRRGAVVVALEQLEDGDQKAAVESLLSALEDGQTKRRHRCHLCRMDFEWPGLLSHHLQLGHGDDPE
jgi:hypothetical protein